MTLRLSAADIEIERDVEYGKGGDTPLLLDIYRPKGRPKELLPAVMMVHGGGWRDCDKMTVPMPPRNLAARGYFVASIDYRLSGKACFPAAVEDCKCAVRWMRAHAGTYSVDPDRIGVVGASAGGHLVLMLGCADEKAGFEGTGGHPNQSSRVQAVCDFCGPTDLLTQELKPPLLIEVEQDFIGATIDQKPAAFKKASPIEYVSRENPPTLIIHGDQDDIVPTSSRSSCTRRCAPPKST
jgi:acetyl esterase/lipase